MGSHLVKKNNHLLVNANNHLANECPADDACDCSVEFGGLALQITISGLPEGETWLGFGNGVHLLCPNENGYYTNQSTNATTQNITVSWVRNDIYNTDALFLRRTLRRIDYGAYTGGTNIEFISFQYDNNGGYREIDFLTYNQAITSTITNSSGTAPTANPSCGIPTAPYFCQGFMQTLTVNGVTFTWDFCNL